VVIVITILIAKDEKKIRKILADLLKQEKMAGVDSAHDRSALKDNVVHLENSLYNEKKGVLYRTIIGEIEKPLIERAMERAEGNQLKAARALGINRNTIRSKIKRLGIDVGKWKV